MHWRVQTFLSLVPVLVQHYAVFHLPSRTRFIARFVLMSSFGRVVFVGFRPLKPVRPRADGAN